MSALPPLQTLKHPPAHEAAKLTSSCIDQCFTVLDRAMTRDTDNGASEVVANQSMLPELMSGPKLLSNVEHDAGQVISALSMNETRSASSRAM